MDGKLTSGTGGPEGRFGPITVAIVEDDQKIRSSLATILGDEEGFQCCGAYESAEEALEELEELSPKVVLLDINLPGIDGIECARRLRGFENSPQIIMLTIRQDPEIIFDALSAGANGYLLKPPTAVELLESIRDVSKGGAPMTASIARRVVQSFRQPRPPSAEIEGLSPREREVLDLLSKGFAYKEVSAELGISYSTVQRHIERIYQKLHVHSATHAVAKYLGA